MSLNQIFEDLAANPSRNFKLDYLNQHAQNETLREVVRLALDPFTQFYQRKIPAYAPNTTEYPASLQAVLPALSDLSLRLVTGHAAINYLQMVLESVAPDDAKVIERIIKKDLNCGVQVSTANDVWMGLIKEYPVMLCSPYEQKLVDKITFPAYAQMKMDGMRFNAIVRDGKVEFRSRNGKEILLLGNLEAEFAALAGPVDCVFDGELLVMDNMTGQFIDRQTGNGILNKANKGTISAEDAAKVHASVWDVIPYAYFTDGHCPTPYSTRFAKLESLVSHQNSEGKKIWSVASTIVETLDQAQEIFQDYLAKGYEGIILKDGNGEWEDKRSKGQIKFKGELECDLKIVGFEQGTGKYSGQLGAIVCESSDSVVKVNVGSGFNDEQRLSFSQEIIGKIVAVKYNARITNKQGEQSLFLPIFIELREDKDVADSSGDIK
jgi:hypothetical protein